MSKTCILNASNPKNVNIEHDRYVDLRDRLSCFRGEEIIKQCRSWHSWAYALETEFFVYNTPKWPGIFQYDNIIVLVNRDIEQVIPLVQKLKKMNKKIAISYHEGIQDLTNDRTIQKIFSLQQIVDEAGIFINFLGQYRSFFSGLFPNAKVFTVNHTNPFDWSGNPRRKSWETKRKDILIGTRTLGQSLSRNTFVTLATLSGWLRRNPNRRVDWISEDPGDLRGILDRFGFTGIHCEKGPLDYNRWLDFISDYKYIVHHDLSMNLGQISLDAFMVDSIPFGGTTWINKMIQSDDGGDIDKLISFFDWKHEEKLENIQGNIVDLLEVLHPDAIKRRLEEVFK